MLKFILVFLLLLVSQPCLAQTNVLTVEGYGSSHSSALSDAKRKAVEQGIGTLIASQTVVKNFQLISDRIYSKADGFVKSYKELGSRQESDGSFVVKIEAEVTAILDEVVKDQMATDLLLQWMHKPRFMFLIDEENVGDRSSMVAETEIGRLMDQKGFPVVSRYQIDQIKKRSQALREQSGNIAAAIAVAQKFGAEYIVLGKANATITDASSMLGDGWVSGKANISAQVIRTDTGEILAQHTYDGAAPEINQATAGMKALKKAAAELSDYLIKETIRKWSLAQTNIRMVSVRIDGITRSQRKLIESFMKTGIEGVQSIHMRSFSLGTADFAVEVAGEPGTLADALDGKELGNITLEITEESMNSLTLRVKSQ